MRFLLRHGDKNLLKAFKAALKAQRKQLNVPNPTHGNKNRRALKRSWSAIESIDIGTHSNQSKSSAHRTAESKAAKAIRRTSKAELKGWNLTVKL